MDGTIRSKIAGQVAVWSQTQMLYEATVLRSLEESGMSVVFFFFQAEDGIRDSSVTGVQTCALPISMPAATVAFTVLATVAAGIAFLPSWRVALFLGFLIALSSTAIVLKGLTDKGERSEERRVGKEGRSRWSPYH